jgi:hypothetical protein
MFMNKTLAAVCAVLVIASASARAEEWQAMGPRALGMGGAGVALSQGPVASYWNPASLGLATENAYGMQMPFGVHAALTGPVIAGANDLKNSYNAINACQGNPASCATPAEQAALQNNLNAALVELNNPANGLRVNADGGGDFKVGKLAFFANGFLDAGAVPQIDLTHNQATYNGEPGYNPNTSIQNNNSALVVKGARDLEFGVGYGHEIPRVPGLYAGANIKLMNVEVGYAKISVISANNGNSDIASQLKSSATTSSSVGVDVGLLWDVSRSFENVPLHPRIGITGRNLTNPKFNQSASAVANGVNGKYAINPQVRMGVAISPFHWWNLAADVDLTNNTTPIDGVDSRQLGVGTEFNVFNRSWINIPLRAGISKNLAESGSSTMLSLGGGLNFLHLIIDASGTASPTRINTQTQGKTTRIPQELGAAVQISLLFGGSEESRHKKATDLDQDPFPSTTPPPSAKPAGDLPPSQTDSIRKHAADSQKELDQQSAPTAPATEPPTLVQ